MPRFIVVVGTDTGVGKTVITAELARALVGRGRRVVALKPVETGCAGPAPRPEEDGVALAVATGQAAPREALVRLRAPLTPALAAEREGYPLRSAALVAATMRAAGDAEVALVEGAGGLLSPLSWGEDFTHVAAALEARILVVGPDRLGVLNHVLLTLRALDAAGLEVAAVALSAPAEDDASTGSNADALRKALGARALSRQIAAFPRLDRAGSARHEVAELATWLEHALFDGALESQTRRPGERRPEPR